MTAQQKLQFKEEDQPAIYLFGNKTKEKLYARLHQNCMKLHNCHDFESIACENSFIHSDVKLAKIQPKLFVTKHLQKGKVTHNTVINCKESSSELDHVGDW